MRYEWMKTLKLAAAAAMAAGGMAVSATPAAADPGDPICIMEDWVYCTYYEGHVLHSPGFNECMRRYDAQREAAECGDEV